ncbi:glycosyltransferase family 4 protein [Methanomicrobium antiquum]|uniref:Glycosyltransferase family 4 protein n=1 Tax=Methanomicrobium antiquum TaxID=487686 RepID=A0AAF0FN74_9EURY|nr:glycosyltransferase family 4 protein [Methanomicrobium antiquum]WFN37398.1 glycosyltransferase family 4 protein [Methanomicrobium antiquum]
MNILFIHEVDYNKKVIFDMHELAESLSVLGHSIYLIDYQDTWQRENLIDFGYIKTKEFSNKKRIYDEASICLIRPGFFKIPGFDRFSAMISHYYAIKSTIKKYNIDVIILYSVPTNGIQSILLAKKYEVPVVFRSIDNLHGLVKSKTLSKFTFYFEKYVYKNVDCIIALTPKLADYVINFGAKKEKVKLLLFGTDTKKFHPSIDVSELKNAMHIGSSDRIIIFIGTFFDFSGLDLYVRKFSQVVKEIPEAKLILVGGGPLFERVKLLINELNLTECILLTGFQQFELMPEFINLADLCINPFQINDTTRDIIPGKVYQYLACAKPVLATPLQGMKELLPNENYGIIYSDIDDFAKNTIKILKDESALKKIGIAGFRHCIENNDKLSIVKQLEQIICDLECYSKSVEVNNNEY